MLTLAGAATGSGVESSQNLAIATEDPPNEQGRRRDCRKSVTRKLQDYFKYDKINEPPSKARNTLLVIAVLIVTATYQAVLSPPGGVWQDDNWSDTAAAKNGTAEQPPRHTAGESIMGTHDLVSFSLFLFFNSIGFFMSLHMMNFLTHGLPLQCELRIALFALAATYDTCILAISPTILVVVLFIMPFAMPMVTKLVRNFKKESLVQLFSPWRWRESGRIQSHI